MKRTTVLEAVKNLTVLKAKRDRDGGGVKSTVRLLGGDRETQMWWRTPPKGERMIVHFRPYPDGWAQLSQSEQDEASKEAAIAIDLHIKTMKRSTRSEPRRRR